MRVSNLILLASGVMFVCVAVIAVVAPGVWQAQFDIAPATAKAASELRALYGGIFLGWAAMVVMGLRPGTARQGALLGLAVTLGAIAALRLVCLALDGAPDFNIPAMLAEALIAGAAWRESRFA